MTKLVFCLRRLAHLTPQQFQTHWYEVHAPLMRKHQQVLRIARYVQLHPAPGPLTDQLRASRHAPEPYDGIAEIWYDSDALDNVGHDPRVIAAARELLDDEQRFIDHTRSPIWLSEERVIISPSAPRATN